MSQIYATIDGFFDDPVAERARALASPFKTVEHNELNYRGVSIVEDKENCDRIEEILGQKMEGPRTVYWRRNLQGEANETYIHSDCRIGTFTGVAYLTPRQLCQGGTAFWRHKKFGWVGQPSKDEMKAVGVPDTLEFWKEFYSEGFDESKWDLLDVAEMKWNRLVLFPSARFHSRYPKESFGTDLENGRLIKVFFLQNKDVFQVRQFNPRFDYVDICSWWEKRGWPLIDLEMLPTTGYIAEDKEHKLAAAFLYLTNSKMAWLEFMVSNPESPMRARKRGVDSIIDRAIADAKALGIKTIFTSLESKGLKRVYEKHGFSVGDTGMTNLLRHV